jgi:hypothetical protein
MTQTETTLTELMQQMIEVAEEIQDAAPSAELDDTGTMVDCLETLGHLHKQLHSQLTRLSEYRGQITGSRDGAVVFRDGRLFYQNNI